MTALSNEATTDTLKPDGAHAPRRSWLDGFRRITTSGEFIPEIDGLRFIAIAAVIIHHLGHFVSSHQNQPDGPLSIGQRGVELFFAISGFILAVPFARQYILRTEPVLLKRYFWRRLTRLEPPYLISLLMLTVLRVIVRGEDLSIIAWNTLFSAFYVHGFAKGVGSQINGVAWSLEIEIQFYLLMPLLALLFLIPNRWARRGVIVLFAAGMMSIQPILFRGIFVNEVMQDGLMVRMPFYLERHLINYIQYFLAGLLLADVYVTEWRSAPPAMKHGAFAWGDAVWLIGWPAMIALLLHGQIASRVAFPILIFLLYFALFHSVIARRLMRIPVVTIIGGMCYSIYLLHNTVIEGAGMLVRRILPGDYVSAFAFSAIVMIPLILLICGLFYRLVERPCMRPDWPARVWAWAMSKMFIEQPDPPVRSE